ncbi:SUMF1/EgtB/PvdO family nonheme iron enzyme [Dyadobacter frigoris]|uniref:Sulfatase-modifying factor enzyme-like domain-containing protein n=1 Tax=Dyadobacter frigoris TaxID=2576211 RepID=A0A4U6D7B9_9BACT|nr:SUMF1/EgtB/PvdO family nonheme iron enzyme [Dyadobacter frigoris]TKT93320.1 hypothetical protein FDK13_05565 [Dyadobacter frigoris]
MSNVVYKKLVQLLEQIAKVSFSDIIESEDIEGFQELNVWKYPLNSPLGTPRYCYVIVPGPEDSILPEIEKPDSYIIIDCFENFEERSDATNPYHFLTDFIFNADEYYKYLRRQSVYRDIDSLYTGRKVSFFNHQEECLQSLEQGFSLEGLIYEWKKNCSKPLLILGERGIGKSWSVQNFCRIGAEQYHSNPWVESLPIYINLKLLSGNTSGLTDIRELTFYHLKNLYGIRIFGNYATFLSLINLGMVILVLDGLDEMSKEVSNEIVIKNLWQVFTLFSGSSKFILTSRKNFFSSGDQIKEHFSYEEYLAVRNVKNLPERVYKDEERRIRQDFNIWEIEPFEIDARIHLLEKAHNISNNFLEAGLRLLQEFEHCSEQTIEREIFNLWDIPGYFLPILRLLSTENAISRYDLFEQCINLVIIEYNIETNRALDRFRIITSAADTYPDQDVSIRSYSFGVSEKNEILRKLAWYMIERNLVQFSMTEFPDFIREIDGQDFDILLNDLQTQTVITLKDEGKYGFVSESIFGFYVANHILLLLESPDFGKVKLGLQNLGRYDLSSSSVMRKASVFLREKLTGARSTNTFEVIHGLENGVRDIILYDPPYSAWQKYLTRNIEILGISLKEIPRVKDVWVSAPISYAGNKVDELMLLIPGTEDINPFFLGLTEVTNRQYYEFLYDDINEDPIENNEFLTRWWRKSESKNPINPFREIINYYHIIFWSSKTRIPAEKEDHPIVWVSWYAAAMYCNWLSRKEGMTCYYNFEIEEGKFKRLTFNRTSYGYRLPTSKEWIYAAREGGSDFDSFLDNIENAREKIRIMEKFSKMSFDTYPVKNENANKLGIYGLMGNVREWVETESENDQLFSYSLQSIKGVGWLSDDKSFNFNSDSFLIAQNNNADVGFRICRSLSDIERKRVDEANLNWYKG